VMLGSIAGANDISPIVPVPPPAAFIRANPSCHAYASLGIWFHNF
jgi:hypothetical protein